MHDQVRTSLKVNELKGTYVTFGTLVQKLGGDKAAIVGAQTYLVNALKLAQKQNYVPGFEGKQWVRVNQMTGMAEMWHVDETASNAFTEALTSTVRQKPATAPVTIKPPANADAVIPGADDPPGPPKKTTKTCPRQRQARARGDDGEKGTSYHDQPCQASKGETRPQHVLAQRTFGRHPN